VTKGKDEISMRICEGILQKMSAKKKKENKYTIRSKVLQEQSIEK
jgi:hypothetical protein